MLARSITSQSIVWVLTFEDLVGFGDDEFYSNAPVDPTSNWCNAAAIVFAFEQWFLRSPGLPLPCLCRSGSAAEPFLSAPHCSFYWEIFCRVTRGKLTEAFRRLNFWWLCACDRQRRVISLAAPFSPFYLVNKEGPHHSPFRAPCETQSIVRASHYTGHIHFEQEKKNVQLSFSLHSSSHFSAWSYCEWMELCSRPCWWPLSFVLPFVLRALAQWAAVFTLMRRQLGPEGQRTPRWWRGWDICCGSTDGSLGYAVPSWSWKIWFQPK